MIDPVVTDAFPRALASPLNTPIAVLLPMIFALVHGARRYGWSGILIFLVLCLGISNIMENLGVMTGFPFGRYHYTDVLGPKLFLVPLLTVWLFMQVFALYNAWRGAPAPVRPKAHWYQASVFYAVMAMDLVASYLGGQNAPITDATGRLWQTRDLFETAAIMGLFGMPPFAVASFVTLLLRDVSHPAKT